MNRIEKKGCTEGTVFKIKVALLKGYGAGREMQRSTRCGGHDLDGSRIGIG